jgi:hypothetical protein
VGELVQPLTPAARRRGYSATRAGEGTGELDVDFTCLEPPRLDADMISDRVDEGAVIAQSNIYL